MLTGPQGPSWASHSLHIHTYRPLVSPTVPPKATLSPEHQTPYIPLSSLTQTLRPTWLKGAHSPPLDPQVNEWVFLLPIRPGFVSFFSSAPYIPSFLHLLSIYTLLPAEVSTSCTPSLLASSPAGESQIFSLLQGTPKA